MDVRRPDALNLEYTRTMMGFLLFRPRPARIAMVGLGGGSLAKFCYRYLPAADITVIEINPQVIALRDEFLIPPDCDRFRVIEDDGADFVRTTSQQFDVLLTDGYDHRGLPHRLCSQIYYDQCAKVLEPDGMLIANLHFEHQDYVLHIARIRFSFNGNTLLAEDDDEEYGIVFACRDGLSTPLAPIRRPSALDERTWMSLQGPFARVISAFNRKCL